MNSPNVDRHGGAEWSALMARAQDGDRKAYETLLRAMTPYIRAVARRVHAAPDQVEEVVQDVLLTVHRVRHTYDPSRPLEPWLAAIARRRSIDVLRRRRRTEAHEVADAAAYETFADPAANRHEERPVTATGLNAAVAGLPARQRAAIRLVKLRGLSLADASAASGMSIVALKVNVHRAIKSLRKRMIGEDET